MKLWLSIILLLKIINSRLSVRFYLHQGSHTRDLIYGEITLLK